MTMLIYTAFFRQQLEGTGRDPAEGNRGQVHTSCNRIDSSSEMTQSLGKSRVGCSCRLARQPCLLPSRSRHLTIAHGREAARSSKGLPPCLQCGDGGHLTLLAMCI
jgi:hypothetical protein